MTGSSGSPLGTDTLNPKVENAEKWLYMLEMCWVLLWGLEWTIG